MAGSAPVAAGADVYRVGDYLWMLADDSRVTAYAGAIRALVKPGDRVLDLGAGVGFFSILAIRAGAAHADAVEMNPAVHLGPRVAAANGCASSIAFHACDARTLTLSVPADVLLADLRGPTPFCGHSLETLIDVRRRLLRRCGTMIASRDTVYAAPARAPLAFRREIETPLDREGVSLDPVARVVYDTPLRCRIASDELIAPGAALVTVDYRTVDSTDHSGGASWEIERPGTADGLAVWFESDVGGGFGFSTAPGNDAFAYGQLFLPFRKPIGLSARDTMRAHIAVHLAGDDYVWVWRAWTRTPEQHEERLVVDQNSLAEIVIDPAALAARSEVTERPARLVSLETRDYNSA